MPSQSILRRGERVSGDAPFAPFAKPARRFQVSFLPGVLALCVLCASCGAVVPSTNVSAPPPVPVSITVAVSPASASTVPGGHVQFTATVNNAQSSAVDWQVGGSSAGATAVGTVDSTGMYTAPEALPSVAIVVTAISQANPTAKASASVTIQGTLSISPTLASVTTQQIQQFNVKGAANDAVTWLVDQISGGNTTVGTISNGLYVPPSTPAAGWHTITAFLTASPGVSGSATIAITDFAGTH
jgi:hypothetical protein